MVLEGIIYFLNIENFLECMFKSFIKIEIFEIIANKYVFPMRINLFHIIICLKLIWLVHIVLDL